MENSQLFFILQSLDKKEMRAFQKWIVSPYHNQREDVLQLWDYLSTDNRLEEGKALEKEQIFCHLFPHEPFDDAKLRQTYYFMQKCVESFLVWQVVDQQPTRHQLLLAGELRRRQLYKSHQKVMNKVEKNIALSPHQNRHWLEEKFLWEEEQYAELSKTNRSNELNLLSLSNNLDQWYISTRLRVSNLMISHQSITGVAYHDPLRELLLSYVPTESLEKVPAIATYFYICKAMTEVQSPENYFALRDLLLEQRQLFPDDERRDLFLLAINYCIRKMNAGEALFRSEAFQLYKIGFDEGFIVGDAGLSRWTFLNVVFIALSLEEFDWVTAFIELNAATIDQQHRENFVHFSKARLFYEQKAYASAMQQLVQSDYKDNLLTLFAKTLLMKIYYEEEEMDALESLLETVRAYLSRKKISGAHKDNAQNIIRCFRKLVRLPYGDRAAIQSFREEIQQTSPLTEKPWFLAQLNQLAN